LCLLAANYIRDDCQSFLLNAWNQIQQAELADKLIRLTVMVKNINLIPDPARRQLAFHQAYFMAKYLLTNCGDKFFHRYGTLMKALEDMDAESAFQQTCNFNFEKFFPLFREWVRVTNAIIAVSE